MSILDRLTDDGLKILVQAKDVQIAALLARVKFLEEEKARLEKWGNAKTRRIAVLSEDIAELKKGVLND
jgi:hypothetical protein